MNDNNGETRTLRSRKKERTRESILSAAEDIFASKNYDEVLIDEIAERAFVSRATLYNYFRNGKEDILFAVGNRVYKRTNEDMIRLLPQNISGKEQVLFYCNRLMEIYNTNSIILKISREFYRLLTRRNIIADDLIKTVVDNLGKDIFVRIFENPSIIEESDLEDKFDEPYLFEYFLQAYVSANLWLTAIRKGKEDGSIKNTNEDAQISQYVNILMNGLVYEMELRPEGLSRIGSTPELYASNTVALIRHFLETDMS